jgi:hypothetical protein
MNGLIEFNELEHQFIGATTRYDKISYDDSFRIPEFPSLTTFETQIKLNVERHMKKEAKLA